MSTVGSFNRKNPTIKRILKEASELASNVSADFHATPLEDNLFEWHFTLKGPPAPSPYAGGIYHGRIVLPSAYPHRPPSFRFLTPSGRFEVNREICLSISGFHEETWQPAWGIRTALVAIRSFMDTGAAGQVGGLECDDESRRRMAAESTSWKCPTCRTSNADIIEEREKAVKESEEQGIKAKEESVPEELRLAYREDLGGSAPSTLAKGKEKAEDTTAAAVAPQATSPMSVTGSEPAPPAANPVPATTPTSTIQAASQSRQPATAPIRQAPPSNQNQGSPVWIDYAIYAVVAALAFLVLRRAL